MGNIKLSEQLQSALKSATGEDAIKLVTTNAINGVIDLEKQIETSFKVIQEQDAQIQKGILENPNYRPVSKIKSGSYRVNHAIRTADGVIRSINDIASDDKLVADLAKSGSTAVTKLTEEELENS